MLKITKPVLLLCALLPLAMACTTARNTAPQRTASEQLLISAAADRAAAQLSLGIPKGTKVFIETRFFQGYDDGYAVAAIRTQMLKNGLLLMDERKDAEAVVQVASGALSTDQKSLLVGIPQLTVPYIPVGNSVTVPEIALFKQAEEKGVAKFVATGYDAKTGELLATTDARYGFSHNTNHTILLFFSWSSGDVIPPGVDQHSLSFRTFTNMLPGGN
ncbi:MAG TPA: DUF6655 family protein [Rhizomicrobium sp.]|jgi:hypothetical protein|nr:DUF6655 family protein [Rhizomicrobium sp.]